MLIIADSGSTKTSWAFVENGQIIYNVKTSGLNPVLMNKDDFFNVLKSISIHNNHPVQSIRFYGAGCREPWSTKVRLALEEVFHPSGTIEVESDLLGAARSLFGNKQGIACILGTGSNSCLYNGHEIISNVPPMGYILGDEGSGAALGKLFINALYKGILPESMRDDYLTWASLNYSQLISRVYHEPNANRFLASTSLYISNHLECEPLRRIVKDNFRNFFHFQLNNYHRKDLHVGIVGSVGFHYQDLLKEVASTEGYVIDNIIKEPLEGLIAYG